jgi:hypothetical protein
MVTGLSIFNGQTNNDYSVLNAGIAKSNTIMHFIIISTLAILRSGL